jgi:hypothetical protein
MQVDGEHYHDGSKISSSVTNDATIIPTLMVMMNNDKHMCDVHGAFLHGKFSDGKEIYLKVPEGFEKYSYYAKD